MGGYMAATVYLEARPKGRPEGSRIDDYVVEDRADHVLATFRTQREAIQWAKQQGHSALVARVRHLNDKKIPDHWRATASFRENDFLHTVVSGYEAEGFSVFLHPSREMRPPFLGGYQPDAIAVKDDRKIAIEIKDATTANAAGMEQLQQIFSAHPGWELRVYYIPGPPQEEEYFKAPDIAEIDTALAEVDQLKRAGHLRAALMMAWAALEAAGRVLLPQSLARPQPAHKLIEALASEGVVTPTEADSLRRAISLRNAATHGHFAVPITEKEVDQVAAAASLIRGLAKDPS
jgi:uncharacterized protein YutE (UPF0331/DUF86 family)